MKILLSTFLVISVHGITCKIIGTDHLEQIESNSINAPTPTRNNALRSHDWIKVAEAPPKVVNVPIGGSVELECEMIGSPAPEIQWMRGRQQFQRRLMQSKVGTKQHKNYSERGGIGRIRSRLTIDCVTPGHEGFYSCVAWSGNADTQAPATLIMVEADNQMTGGCTSSEQGSVRQPRILSWSPTTMETMGSNVLLPCSATGYPHPLIYWLDQDNNVINNPRYKVLENGDLAISQLSWDDMGQLTCVAENSVGRDSVNTFIYPVMNEP